MSNEFVRTQLTLLERIAVEKTGEDEGAWCRFFELYYPAMVTFARGIGGGEHAEDVVQDVLVKLVEVLRHGGYERQDGKSFRAYLKTLIRNKLSDLYRREKARGLGLITELTDQIAEESPSDTPGFGDEMDREWAAACQSAAVEHVLTKTALAEQSKAVYRAYVLEGRPIGDVAKTFGMSRNNVSKIKERVDKAVLALVSEYGN